MTIQRPRLLIAAPSSVIRELSFALGDAVEVIGADTWDQALERLGDPLPSLIVVCYAFDQMRPFRLVHHLRAKQDGRRLPIILVRALPVPLGRTQEVEIRQSYQNLGVDEFVNLYDTRQQAGTAAAFERFRDLVFARLPRTAAVP
jgi:CheY-like chemotaxis protein